MKRLLSIVVVFTLVPASAAWATELDEILERSHAAEYSAEQIISCSTPDGVQDTFVTLVQSGNELRVSSKGRDGVEVTAGEGDWTASRPDGPVTGASVDDAQESESSLYSVEDEGAILFLGRPAQAYRLHRDGVLRAELVVDDDSGALVQAVTFNADGDVYCERRFVSLDETPPIVSPRDSVQSDPLHQVEDSTFPSEVSGFDRLDHYEGEAGFSFAYYSDGFFSFALFETHSTVQLPGSSNVEFASGVYARSFSPGQVSFAWETKAGGMAMIGDLPPDLHDAVLSEMPPPENRGLLRRWWRALFG